MTSLCVHEWHYVYSHNLKFWFWRKRDIIISTTHPPFGRRGDSSWPPPQWGHCTALHHSVPWGGGEELWYGTSMHTCVQWIAVSLQQRIAIDYQIWISLSKILATKYYSNSLLRSLSFFCSLSQKRKIGGTKKERRKQLRKRRACLAKSRDPLLT